jgi:hypothetical protein
MTQQSAFDASIPVLTEVLDETAAAAALPGDLWGLPRGRHCVTSKTRFFGDGPNDAHGTTGV